MMSYGSFRRGAGSYVKAVGARLGQLRRVVLCRGGQGVARSSSVRYGLSRRSRQGLLGRVGSRWGEAVAARSVKVRWVKARLG